MKFNLLKQITGFLAVLVASGCASTTGAPQARVASDSLAVDSIGVAAVGDVISVPAETGLGSTSVVVSSEYMAASRRLCRRMQTPQGKPVSRVACKNENGQWILARDLVPASTFMMSSAALTQPTLSQPEISGAQASILDSSSVNTSSFQSSEGELGNVYESGEVASFESEINAGSIVVNEMSVDGMSVSDISLSETGRSETGRSEINGSDISMQPMGQLAAVEFVVLANETLWSFAKRTTGNALNWQRIAEINNIDDARTVSDGDVLKVPAELEKSGS